MFFTAGVLPETRFERKDFSPVWSAEFAELDMITVLFGLVIFNIGMLSRSQVELVY